jgi:hypothetical protein
MYDWIRLRPHELQTHKILVNRIHGLPYEFEPEHEYFLRSSSFRAILIW